MRRDMDLVRAVLLLLEKKTDPAGIKSIDFQVPDGFSQDDTRNHLIFICEAGFTFYEPMLTKTGRIVDVYVFDLTWKGHEFLDTVRDPKAWSFTKDRLRRAGNWSCEMIAEVAKSYTRTKLASFGVALD